MKTYIVLISVDDKDARKKCEEMENTILNDDHHDNPEMIRDSLASMYKIDIENIYIWSMTDFMDEFNNEYLNTLNWFMSYIHVQEPYSA